MALPEVGATLVDGYGYKIVLQAKYEKRFRETTLKHRFAVILCLWEGKFVVWGYDTVVKYAFSGDYDNETLEEAIKSYNKRGE